MAVINDHATRFRKGLANPFSSIGAHWCDRCRTETTARTEAVHSGTTYGFKQWCLRCGKVAQFGVYNNVPLLAGAVIPAAAMEWTRAGGEDRR